MLTLSLVANGQTLDELGFVRHPSNGVFVEPEGNFYQSSKFYVKDESNGLYIVVDGDNFQVETDRNQLKCGLLGDELVVDEQCKTDFALGQAKWFRFKFNQPSQIRAIKVVDNATNTELR